MRDFWFGDGGVAGEYMYGTTHIASVIALAVVCLALTLVGLKSNGKTKRKIVVGLALFALGFEVFWRAIYYFYRQLPLTELYPFYPCNLAGIIVPLIALTNNRLLKDLFYVFAFIGGLITFAMPEDIFNNMYLTFPILKSILQHCFIIIIPVFEYFNKTYVVRFKNFYLSIIGMFVHLFNSEYIPRLMGITGTDYMFLRSGLPFTIDGIPGWLVTSVFAIVVVTITFALLDIKGFIRIFSRKKRCRYAKC